MPAVLVTDPTDTQNSSFLPPAKAETIASTHCIQYLWRDGQAEWPGIYQDGIPARGGHQSQH